MTHGTGIVLADGFITDAQGTPRMKRDDTNRSAETMTTKTRYRCEAITKNGHRCQRVTRGRQNIDEDGRRVCFHHIGPGGRTVYDEDEFAAKTAELERCG